MIRNGLRLFSASLRSVQMTRQICHLPSVGINGFGRIGKCVLRLAIQNDINVVALNEPGADIGTIAHSLKHDTVHGTFGKKVSIIDNCNLEIGGKTVRVYKEANPEKIKWNELLVDYVIDATGRFTEVGTAKKHMAASVKKVIISAPSKDAPMFVKAVNFDEYKKDMTVVSNASCTTNCAAPLLQIINTKFCIEHCLLTTVHAMTSTQPVLDGIKNRSAPGNIVHSTTGAAKAVGLVLPALKDKVHGDSIRVPVLDVSLLKLYINLKKEVTPDEIKCEFIKSSACGAKGVISYFEESIKLVSSDFTSTTYSAIVDFNQISVMGGKFLTIGAWYDNEMGYSRRLLDLYEHMVKVDNDRKS